MFSQTVWLGLFLCAVGVPAAPPTSADVPMVPTTPVPDVGQGGRIANPSYTGVAAPSLVVGVGVPPAPVASPAPSSVRPDNADLLSQELARLKANRQSLAAERNEVPPGADSGNDSTSEQISKLRLRLGELVTKSKLKDGSTGADKERQGDRDAGTQGDRDTGRQGDKGSLGSDILWPAPSVAVSPQSGSDKSPKKTSRVGVTHPTSNEERPVDALSLSVALVNTGDYEGALTAYQLVDLKNAGAEVRVTIQYMKATCLRRLGKIEEAETQYREIANSRADAMITDCAQWQLQSIRSQRELEAELEQLRQHRKSLEETPANERGSKQ